MKTKNLFIIRLVNGFKEIAIHKWKLIFPALYILLMAVAWINREPIFSMKETIPFHILYEYIKTIILIIAGILGFLCLFTALGTPLCTNSMKEKFMQIGFINYNGDSPIILSYVKKKKNKYTTMIFDNKGIFYLNGRNDGKNWKPFLIKESPI